MGPAEPSNDPLQSSQVCGTAAEKFISLQARLRWVFLAFAHKSNFDFIDASDLDYTLAEYLNCMHQEGEPVSAAGHALSGIKRFIRELRIQLPTASQYSRNLQRGHRPL